MNLVIAPHQDDEVLFMGYTLMREKPLVLIVTDGYIQFERGDNITAEQRRFESINACKLLGCPVVFGGIRDTQLNTENCADLLSKFKNFDRVYIPAIIENGNPQHNLIGKIAKMLFPKAVCYMSYSKTDLSKKGSIEIQPSKEEIELKNRALDCYRSQINLPSTRPHFDAVRGQSEYYD